QPVGRLHDLLAGSRLLIANLALPRLPILKLQMQALKLQQRVLRCTVVTLEAVACRCHPLLCGHGLGRNARLAAAAHGYQAAVWVATPAGRPPPHPANASASGSTAVTHRRRAGMRVACE